MDVKLFEKKLIEVYDAIGYISVVGAILSGILWIWIPRIGVRLFFSFVILFVGILILYGFCTKEGREISKKNLQNHNKY